MAEPRKASEVLLDLENRLGRLEAEIKLNNASLALVLKKLNEITKPEIKEKVEVEVIKSITPTIEVEAKESTPRRGEALTKASNADITFKDYMQDRALKQKAQEASVPKPAIPQAPVELKQEKKIPVSQKVQYSDHSDVFMAKIEILTARKQSVLTTKTNALGKWQGQLAPGEYTLKLVKNVVDGQVIEIEQQIVVPNANCVVNLNPLIINR